jgi:hypothetical protein
MFVPRGTLRRTTSGKIQRKACRQLFLDGALDEIVHPAHPRDRVTIRS